MQMAVAKPGHDQPVAAVDDGFGFDPLDILSDSLDAVAQNVDVAPERLTPVGAAHRQYRGAADQDRHGGSPLCCSSAGRRASGMPCRRLAERLAATQRPCNVT